MEIKYRKNQPKLTINLSFILMAMIFLSQCLTIAYSLNCYKNPSDLDKSWSYNQIKDYCMDILNSQICRVKSPSGGNDMLWRCTDKVRDTGNAATNELINKFKSDKNHDGHYGKYLKFANTEALNYFCSTEQEEHPNLLLRIFNFFNVIKYRSLGTCPSELRKIFASDIQYCPNPNLFDTEIKPTKDTQIQP